VSTKAKPTQEVRVPLSRERVLAAAIELADADGIESLTMRRLAQALGVEAMTLYYHVANKDDILDGLADIVVAEVEVPPIGDDWKAAIRRRALSAREMLARHPWAAGLIEARTNPSPARSRYPDAVLGSLRQAGFSVEMAIHAFFTLDSYIYGFAVQEQNLPSGTPQELAGMAQMIVTALPAQQYPYLNEVIVDHVLKIGFDYSNEFEFGLDLILDGLEKLRNTA